jgi:hypothetical protein
MKKGLALGWVVNQDGSQSFVTNTMENQLGNLLGSQTVRFSLRLAGHPDWTTNADRLLSTYEEAIDNLIGSGQTVIGNLSNEAVAGMGIEEWNAPDKPDGTQPFRTAYATAAGVLAARFPQIGHWEIWNEPNVAKTHLEEERFAKLLQAANKAIRAANPNPALRVITGGIFAWPDERSVRGTLPGSGLGDSRVRPAVYRYRPALLSRPRRCHTGHRPGGASPGLSRVSARRDDRP